MITWFPNIAHILSMAIFNSIVAGFICYLILMALSWLFRGASSAVKYQLSNVALLTVFISFLYPFASLLHSKPHFTNAATIPIHSVTISETKTVVSTSAAPLSQHGFHLSFYQQLDSITNKLTAWSNIILIMYIIGLILFSLKLWMAYLSTMQLKKNGIIKPDSNWEHYLDAAKSKLNISHSIRLTFSSLAISPCIIGYSKAIILIPVTLASQLTAEQAEAILLHELAHFKQYDYYINLITQFVGCILFFNPFSWLIIKKCKQYREQACDTIAAKQNGSIPLAEALVLIAELNAIKASFALNLKSKDHSLLHRVQALLSEKNIRRPSISIIPAGLITFLTIVCLVLINPDKALSQHPKSLDTQLKEISAQMFNEGNKNFILIDAIRDSLIKFNQPYDFQYISDTSDNIIKINNKDLSQPIKGIYMAKMKDFYIRHNHSHDKGFFSSRGDSVELKQILDPNSSFRKIDKYSYNNINDKSSEWDAKLQKELIKDHLYDTTKGLKIVYNKDGVYIDSKKLKGTLGKKYNEMFKERSGEQHGTDRVSMEFENVVDHKTYINVNPTTKKVTTTTINPSPNYTDTCIKTLSSFNRLFIELAKDHLADTGMKIFITLKEGNLRINFKTITGELGYKYKRLIRPNYDPFDHEAGEIIIHGDRMFPPIAVPDSEYYLEMGLLNN